MAKKNLPNIPIYIGDWERDCNVLSLESEGAWLRIVFKLWTKGKQNSIKMPTKAVQNLWRCSPEKMNEILDEIVYNDIGKVAVSEGFIEFTCRRFVKENKISKIRSEASKGENKKQNGNKTSTKHKQTPENENENDYVNESSNEDKSEIKKFTKKDFRKILIDLGSDETHVDDWFKVRQSKRAVFTQTALKNFVNECNKNNYPIAEAVKDCAENSWSGFKYEWLDSNKNGKQANGEYDAYKAKLARTLTGTQS